MCNIYIKIEQDVESYSKRNCYACACKKSRKSVKGMKPSDAAYSERRVKREYIYLCNIYIYIYIHSIYPKSAVYRGKKYSKINIKRIVCYCNQ